jgi:hypothetical protein
MNDKAYRRDARRVFEAIPVKVLSFETSSKSHFAVNIQYPDGEVKTFALSCSPSCKHSAPLETARVIKRYKKGYYK